MFIGVGSLDERSSKKLAAFAERETAQEIYLGTVQGRAAESMRVGTRMLINAISDSVSHVPVEEDDRGKRSSRFYSAGLLHLLGAHAANVGHIESAEVTLANCIIVPTGTKQAGSDRQYARVSAQLDDVDVNIDTMVGFHREFDARSCTPDQLLEGAARLKVYVADEKPRLGAGKLIEYYSEWIAGCAMPSSYTDTGNRLGEPGHLGELAEQMLEAMIDPGLNPQVQTYEQIASISPQLADQVLDVERPLAEVDFSLLVPAWAKVGAAA